MIHQIKSWIRTTYSYVSPFHINAAPSCLPAGTAGGQGYFDEFCYRLNRFRNRETIFHNLTARMVSKPKSYHSKLYVLK